MESKETCIEWFYKRILANDIKAVFEQAKELHKQEIIEAFNLGQQKEAKQEFWTKGEQYYNETYNK